MGKLKKRFNWKSRQVTDTVTDNTEVEKIPLAIDVREEKYDASNLLVLPSVKRKTKKVKNKNSKEAEQKPLSKKQRKKLEVIVERKKKKMNRTQLLEILQKVQVTPDELKLMTSTSEIGSKKLKRNLLELESSQSPTSRGVKINSIKRGGKRTGSPAKRIKQSDNVLNTTEEEESSIETSDDGKDTLEAHNTSADHTDNTPKRIDTVSQNNNTSISKEHNSKSDVSQRLHASKTTIATKVVDSKRKPAVFVPVDRSPEIQSARRALPILPEEHIIMEAVAESPFVIICGETGSGKTTQVPQFLYEAGYASNKQIIGITEPRRVAAISMSSRVAHEMSLTSKQVSYQIRFEGNVTEETKIKFMTDGVLLKEIQNDFLLTKYSAIIIDEAHERSAYTDILIGLLSRIAPLRKKEKSPLKLIVMSATLRIEDFTENDCLFKVPPPVIKIESRQYPVSVHFNKRTPTDYINEAYKKVCKIHTQQPDGGILVFVTGRQEVLTLCRKLHKTFPFVNKNVKDKNKEISTMEIRENGESDAKDKSSDDEWDGVRKRRTIQKKGKQRKMSEPKKSGLIFPKINLDDYSVKPLDDEFVQEQMSDEEFVSENDDDELDIQINNAKNPAQPMYVLPLYSLLPPNKQRKVFSPPPENTRLCVVATNVAETSLTIPNIKYVVDTGKVKMRMYDQVTGISAFIITWASKASANQRAGRAGRIGPGHCYRLYSSAVFNDEFSMFAPPEITRQPVDDLLLKMKALGIEKVVNFPFPSPPSLDSLKAAEKRLIYLGALEESSKPVRFKQIKRWRWSAKVTPLGRAMSCFPVSPRYAKMLALSHQHNLLPYVVIIVSALTVQEVFLNDRTFAASQEEKDEKEKEASSQSEKQARWVQIKRTWAGTGHSLALGDTMVLLKAVGASEYMGCTPQFCMQHGLRHKAMVEIRKLRKQLTTEANLILPDMNLSVDPKMEPPTDLHAKLLRQVMLAGMMDHVARKIPEEEIKPEDSKKLRHAYKCLDTEDPVFIHPQSVLSTERPTFVIYQEIIESSKLYMRVVTAVEPEWLPVFASRLCTFTKRLSHPPPRYDSELGKVMCHKSATFGRWEWPLPPVEMEMALGLEKYKYFAQFFLEGRICCSLKKYCNVLLSPPVTMVKSWSRLQPRTQIILEALFAKKVDSQNTLYKVWEEDPKYLLKEYCQWLPKAVQSEVGLKWPPISR